MRFTAHGPDDRFDRIACFDAALDSQHRSAVSEIAFIRGTFQLSLTTCLNGEFNIVDELINTFINYCSLCVCTLCGSQRASIRQYSAIGCLALRYHK